MKVLTYDDITGDGAKHKLIDLLRIAGVAQVQSNWGSKWWQVVMYTSAGITRVGDANVSAANGIPIGTPNKGQFAPPIAFATDKYELSDVYVIIATGDVMSVARAI